MHSLLEYFGLDQLDQVNDGGSHESMDIASKTETLEDRFDDLRTRIRSELSTKPGINAKEVLSKLTCLPLLLKKEYESSIEKCIHEMRTETQIDDLFIVHLNPLTSFIDYGLIEYVIMKFGSDDLKRDMRSYCSEMIEFMKETTIKQLIDHLPGQTEIPPKFSLIEAKIGEDASKCMLEHFNNIRKRYCSEIQLSDIIFHLVAVVESNSFIVRWLVPSALFDDIVKSTRNVDQSFYQEYKITSLTLDGMWLHVIEAELEVMWIHMSNTKLIDQFQTMYKQIIIELKVHNTHKGELTQCLMNHHPNLHKKVSTYLSGAIITFPFPPSGFFVDFDMLSIIIEEFGSDCLRDVMMSYGKFISGFVKQLSVQQLLDLPPVPTEDHEGFTKVECRIMEEPSGYTYDKILSIKNSICAETDFSGFMLTMSNVRQLLSDSFFIRWLTPTHFAPDLIESANRIDSAFYVRKSIASLSVGNQWVYNPKLIPFGFKLKEKYQQSQGSPSPVEWIPSPTNKIFQLAMIQRETVQRGHIEDRFVRMTISGRVDDILYAKSPVELTDIFRNTLHGGEIILIEGAPGSGKSTLTVHICQRWGKGELFQQFTVVILVQLRDPAVQRTQTIADLLPVENAEEIAAELIAINGRGVLWVLDGWDELPPHLQQDSIFHQLLRPKVSEEKLKEIRENPLYAEYNSIMFWKVYLQNNPSLLSECSVIVTSRPISSGDLHPVVSSRIEVLGFTPEEQRQYFADCLKGDTKALEALLEKIQENPMVQSICYLPLNAALIVHTFKYRDQSLPNTEYEIHLSVILSCIQRHYDREGIGHDLPRELSSLDDLFRSEAVREPFQCLCELAYRGVMENKVTFSSSDLPQGSNTLGLLQAIESFLQRGKSVFYNFLHLSIQEVLSAYYITTQLSDSEQVSQFQQLFNQPRFAAVFQFYAAITKLKSPGIRQVINRIVEAKSKPLLVPLLHCLYEAQDPALCLYVAERLQYKLHLSRISLSPLDCLSVSFFLSSLTGKETSAHLDHCTIRDLGVKCLSKYLHTENNLDYVSKVTIDLSGNEIHEEGALYIARMLYFIEHLYLFSNPIGDTGASVILKDVREAATLKTLSLNYCGITSRGAEDIVRTLSRNSTLEKFDIGMNYLMGDDGISHVAEALKQNHQLKELWIGDCGITDKGAASLASALTVNNSLKMLHMGGFKGALTEDGLSEIARSLHNKLMFVKLAIPFNFGSTTTDRLSQEVNEARKKNGLPPIEIEGRTAARITDNSDDTFVGAGDDKVDAKENEGDLHEEEVHEEEWLAHKVEEWLTFEEEHLAQEEEVQLTQEEETHLIAIENAITETGMLDHTLVHGVFVGPPRSGKDSIMKHLLGQAASKISPSTGPGAAETAIHVKVEESCTFAATVGQSNWTRLEYDEEALHLLKTTSNNSSVTCPIEGKESTDTQIADPPSAVRESSSDNSQKTSLHNIMQTESTLEIQPEIDSQPENKVPVQMNKIEQIHQKIKHKTPIEIFKEAIKKKGLEGIQKQLTNSWSLYLTNTGGQMEFQELLPLLVSGPSMFFITFQLHIGLNERFQVEYELPSGESSKCYESSLSILDSILQTLSTIAAMGTFVYKGLQKECVPLTPKVFLIGTHKDLLDKKSAATIIDRIDAQLQTVIKLTSHYREGIIQFASKSRMIFTVSNLDPSDSDFQAIRSAVEETINAGDYKMKSPAHWMIYSLVVRQLQNRVESYDECFAIAKECGIKDKNEFDEALHFIHTKMGLVRYFPHEELKDKIVIVDPQILFEKVTELIVETFTFKNLRSDHFKLEAFERQGIFNLSDFMKISSRTGQKLTPTLFATVLEYLRIAARFQQGGETKYFLPCALTHAPEKKNVSSSTIPQLIATFQCGYCPKGLFGTLITFLINNEMQSDIEWELDTDNVYRDEVCFQVGPYDTVTIRFMPTHLQISCAESNPDLPRINCTQEDVCQEVRESVEKGIKTVTSDINYINAQHSFTFYCTSDVCSEDPHPSKLKEFKGKLCSLKCEKLKKPFPLPSGYEKWRLCSMTTKECHSLKERLNKCHCSFLVQQLSSCAYKWKDIGTHLKFQQEELNNILANPLFMNDAPTSWLSALVSDWLEWAPGDSRGSTNYANLEDIKSAVSKAGFGVVAEELSLPQEVAAEESSQSSDTRRKRKSSSAAESSKRPHLS